MYSIYVTDFTGASSADLFKAVNDVVLKMKGKPAYPDEQAQVLVVETSNAAFGQAVSDANGGGRASINNRKLARNALLVQVKLLIRQMELHVDADMSFFLNAGFKVWKTSVRERVPLEAPALILLERGVLSGTVSGKVMNLPKGFTQLAVEFSYDNITWHNGTYTAGKKFLLSGLTPKQNVSVRVRFNGSFQRQSDWSNIREVFVL